MGALWCEGKCRGIRCNGVTYEERKINQQKIRRVERNNEQQSYNGKRLLSDVRANVDAAIEKNNHCRILARIKHLYQGR